LATLFQATSQARKIIFIILLIIIAISGWETYSKYRKSSVVTSPTTLSFYMEADFGVGEVPDLKVPSIVLNQDFNPKFVLEGRHNLTNFPDVSYVYTISQPREKLLTFENAKSTAKVLNFSPEDYEKVDESKVKWIQESGSKVLTYDKKNLTWNLTTNYSTSTSALARKTVLSDILVYANGIKSALSKLGFEGVGFSNGQANVKFMKLGIDGVFVGIDQANDADYVYLTVQRKLSLADLKPDNEMPEVSDKTLIPSPVSGLVYKTDPREGSLNMVVSNRLSNYSQDIFELDFTDFEYSRKGSYLIINPNEAWTKVQQGKAFLVSLLPQNSNYFASFPKNVKVTEFTAEAVKTELGFWEPETWDGFVYPIYIFKGRAMLEDGRLATFTFYVDALKVIE
jgi:hypothetical protein